MRQECYLEVLFSSTVRDQRKTLFSVEVVICKSSTHVCCRAQDCCCKDCNPVIDSPLSWYFSITRCLLTSWRATLPPKVILQKLCCSFSVPLNHGANGNTRWMLQQLFALWKSKDPDLVLSLWLRINSSMYISPYYRRSPWNQRGNFPRPCPCGMIDSGHLLELNQLLQEDIF